MIATSIGRRAARSVPAISGMALSSSLSNVFDNLSIKNNDTITPVRLISTSKVRCQIIGSGNTTSLYNLTKLKTNQVQRWFASDTKDSEDDADKEVDTPTAAPIEDDPSKSSQHSTWVEFQKSIAVSGFETGQTVKEKTLGQKKRGGKFDRKRKEREAEAEAALRGEDITQLKGGEFPALRYSDEETERLLAEAYAAIPPRAGKRGTLHIKREKHRWRIKREYDHKKKLERIAAHERKMAKRSRIAKEIMKTKEEAPEIVSKEREYQDMVLMRWAEMNGHSKDTATRVDA